MLNLNVYSPRMVLKYWQLLALDFLLSVRLDQVAAKQSWYLAWPVHVFSPWTWPLYQPYCIEPISKKCKFYQPSIQHLYNSGAVLCFSYSYFEANPNIWVRPSWVFATCYGVPQLSQTWTGYFALDVPFVALLHATSVITPSKQSKYFVYEGSAQFSKCDCHSRLAIYVTIMWRHITSIYRCHLLACTTVARSNTAPHSNVLVDSLRSKMGPLDMAFSYRFNDQCQQEA